MRHEYKELLLRNEMLLSGQGQYRLVGNYQVNIFALYSVRPCFHLYYLYYLEYLYYHIPKLH